MTSSMKQTISSSSCDDELHKVNVIDVEPTAEVGDVIAEIELINNTTTAEVHIVVDESMMSASTDEVSTIVVDEQVSSHRSPINIDDIISGETTIPSQEQQQPSSVWGFLPSFWQLDSFVRRYE